MRQIYYLPLFLYALIATLLWTPNGQMFALRPVVSPPPTNDAQFLANENIDLQALLAQTKGASPAQLQALWGTPFFTANGESGQPDHWFYQYQDASLTFVFDEEQHVSQFYFVKDDLLNRLVPVIIIPNLQILGFEQPNLKQKTNDTLVFETANWQIEVLAVTSQFGSAPAQPEWLIYRFTPRDILEKLDFYFQTAYNF